MLMHKSRRRRQQTQQWDLFHRPPQTPIWEELPPLVQTRVTELLASLFREHGQAKETDDRVKEDSHE
jgi:hypothetical protein